MFSNYNKIQKKNGFKQILFHNTTINKLKLLGLGLQAPQASTLTAKPIGNI